LSRQRSPNTQQPFREPVTFSIVLVILPRSQCNAVARTAAPGHLVAPSNQRSSREPVTFLAQPMHREANHRSVLKPRVILESEWRPVLPRIPFIGMRRHAAKNLSAGFALHPIARRSPQQATGGHSVRSGGLLFPASRSSVERKSPARGAFAVNRSPPPRSGGIPQPVFSWGAEPSRTWLARRESHAPFWYRIGCR
jgi:hypothetical protein